MDLGGKVWDDTDRSQEKHADAHENGVIDEGEAGVEGVRVRVYRIGINSDGSITYLPNYSIKGVVKDGCYITYTDSSGNWKVDDISVPAYMEDTDSKKYSAYAYDVLFDYDGQTYEPTTFLATANGNASTFINATTSQKDNYLYDSMALDVDSSRQAFNNKFAQITGDESIQDDGTTQGYAIATDGETKTQLNYTSTDSVSVMNGDNTRKISTLQTTDSNGNVYDQYLVTASTSQGGLTFPFNVNDYNEWSLESWDVTSSTGGYLQLSGVKYRFRAIYNYCLSINLGLIEREAADVAVQKDLTLATVVVNGKVVTYKFNKGLDLSDPANGDFLYKQLELADKEIEYTLGLYASDYYYRASIYGISDAEKASDAGKALDTYLKTLGVSGIDSTELDIYLTYTIKVLNESETYDVTINGVDDYSDSTFTLIRNADDTKKYVQSMNGKEINQALNLADSPKVTYYDSNGTVRKEADVTWSEVSNGINGSDETTYNRIRTDSLKGEKLATGEKAEIVVTFKVNKDLVYGIQNAIITGQKNNIAEISNFTSYYSNTSKNKWSNPGDLAGRVDEDSAPNNINITNHNENNWYEDDTYSAPLLTIELYKNDRQMTGVVWDDAQTSQIEYSQTIGDGLYDPSQGDKVIPNLTTEIFEIISIPTGDTDSDGNEIYQEYYFAWPTDQKMQELNNQSLKDLTGFEQMVTTNANGEYSFVGIPAGNYRLRFVYGDKEISTGNSGFEEVYNGQDYKSTAYQVGFATEDSDGYLCNEWHDLTNADLAGTRVSDARDNEARRLYVASKSEILTYDNTVVLKTADDKNADHTELFGEYPYQDLTGATTQTESPVTGSGYYMYAETAKLNLNVEDVNKLTSSDLGGVDIGTVTGSITSNGVSVGTKDFSYVVKNIDCGIEERSQTKLTLDKQIEEITLTTSDGNIILDAVYDITYEVGSNGSIRASVILNEEKSIGFENIASLNRTTSTQGYRYIMADGTILQGATLNVKYRLTTFNVGEADRDTQKLHDLWDDIDTIAQTNDVRTTMITDELDKLSTNLYVKGSTEAEDRRVLSDGTKLPYGTYFGTVYYLGTQGNTGTDGDTLVETKVRQIIDYVDTDVEFSDLDNVSKDKSWSNITIEYLLENKLLDPSIVQVIDKNGNIVMNGDRYVTAATVNAGEYTLDSTDKYAILNDEYQEYVTELKNNLIANIESGEDTDGANPNLVKFTTPYSATNSLDESTAVISLEVSRFFSSESDASDIDNLAEIIKVENTVGRRDIRTIAGNANPFELEEGDDIPDDEKTPVGVYKVAGEEPDTSATEVITLSPPTGSSNGIFILQLILTILVGTTIVAIGIVFIKKKVLIKK